MLPVHLGAVDICGEFWAFSHSFLLVLLSFLFSSLFFLLMHFGSFYFFCPLIPDWLRHHCNYYALRCACHACLIMYVHGKPEISDQSPTLLTWVNNTAARKTNCLCCALETYSLSCVSFLSPFPSFFFLSHKTLFIIIIGNQISLLQSSPSAQLIIINAFLSFPVPLFLSLTPLFSPSTPLQKRWPVLSQEQPQIPWLGIRHRLLSVSVLGACASHR